MITDRVERVLEKGGIDMVKIIVIAFLIYLLLGIGITAFITSRYDCKPDFFIPQFTLFWPLHLILIAVILEFCRRWGNRYPNGV